MSFGGRFCTIALSHFRENPVSLPRRPQAWQSLQKLGLAISFAGMLLTANAAAAKEQSPDATTAAEVAVAQLPVEARVTYRLIRTGGPFPYERDGSVFGNFEGLLPRHERGHYREYTVPTPGSDDRGARRIVTGRNGETYYTDDHYASFTAVLR